VLKLPKDKKDDEGILGQASLSDQDVQALIADLVELEKSGTLDVLIVAVKKMDELLQYLFQEPALYRLMAVALDGSLGAMKQLNAQDVIQLKATVQEIGGCVGKSMGADALKNAKPLGIGGLMAALGDPDVKKGIGITIMILKALGKCASQQEGSSSA